jgi:AcrR family transcriptional regulator
MSTDDDEASPQEGVRTRIIAAAAQLIAAGDVEAATTRAVAAAANVQPPTIYRLFGDKQGLLGAVAEAVMSEYVASKITRSRHSDPVQDLRDGWDTHVAFGLKHPAVFKVMVTSGVSEAVQSAGLEVLQQRVERVAEARLLTVSVSRAVALIQAAGIGTVLKLLQQPEPARDMDLSSVAREAVIAAITRAAPRQNEDDSVNAAAVTLSTRLSRTSALSAGERLLLDELLLRIANAAVVSDPEGQ